MKRHIACLSKNVFHNQQNTALPLSRFISSQEALERRNHLFSLEKKRQAEKVGRIEKIEVRYKGLPKEQTLVMNKNVSTPYDCARHLTEWHVESSALALIDGTVYWDMHKPLTENCTLELQNYSVAEPQQVNKAFWRTCSLMLGACATVAFKDAVPVHLHSFPGPDIRSGSFIYDIDLPSLPDWKPTLEEMYTLSAEYIKLMRKNLPLERLEVSEELALEMYKDNQHKTKQIPSIARNNGKVTLYRAGSYVDISKGPMISSTGQIGRVMVTSVHKLAGSADSDVNQLYRFQGVALPISVRLNHFAWNILTERAKKLNPARSPLNTQDREDSHEQESIVAKA